MALEIWKKKTGDSFFAMTDADRVLTLQAVSEADAVTTPNHPRVVPLLVQLGLIFARTSRVTYAEGIFR
jgi:hypothetical protein